MNSPKSVPSLNKTFSHSERPGSRGKSKKVSAVKKKLNDQIFARKFVTWGVIVSGIMVGVSLFVTIYYKPEAVAKRKFEELAKTYYESYYHGKLVDTIDEEKFTETMKSYEESGLQPVLLRQLLLYQNGKYADYKQFFERDDYVCDKNKTSATFYPVAPYGEKDYKVKYKYECNEK